VGDLALGPAPLTQRFGANAPVYANLSAGHLNFKNLRPVLAAFATAALFMEDDVKDGTKICGRRPKNAVARLIEQKVAARIDRTHSRLESIKFFRPRLS